LTSVRASVADCSRQLVQRTKMHVGPILIVSVVVRIDHCCQTEVAIVNWWWLFESQYTILDISFAKRGNKYF